MNAKDLLVFFAETWKGKHDGKSYPVAWGKEGAMFKRLLTSYDADYCRSLILCFFRDGGHSDFASRAGFSVGVFVSQVPKLVGELERNKQASSAKADTQGNWEKINEARKRLLGG